MPRYSLRTLLIVLALGPMVLAFAYYSPRLTCAFIALLTGAAVADWLARRMSPRQSPPRLANSLKPRCSWLRRWGLIDGGR